MRYLSVCSGIEAATSAWHHLGWEPVAFSEIEPFPSAVLQHHYPNVPNWGDMTKYKTWPDATIDLLVGGTPCQSFSVAGLRKGLEDPRGNLMLTFLGIAQRYRPKYIVWENVPGVLSSNGGRDFGTFLAALGELGYGWAYRVLDAQWFGVAQRRRRVFVVGCLGDQRRAAQVLFESESVSRNTPPSRAKGQGAAADAQGSIGGGSWWDGGDVHPTLNQSAKTSGGPGFSNQELFSQNGGGLVPHIQDVVGSLCADTHPGSYSGQDAYSGRLVPHAADTVTSKWAKGAEALQQGAQSGGNCIPVHAFKVRGGCEGGGKGYLGSDDTAFTVSTHQDQQIAQPVATFAKTHKPMSATDAEGWSPVDAAPTVTHWPRDRSDAGTDVAVVQAVAFTVATHQDQQIAQPVAFDTYNQTITSDTTQTLCSRGDSPGGNAHLVPAVAFDTYNQTINEHTSQSLSSSASDVNHYGAVMTAMQVRRLTPVECERLQGFPDNHTNIPWRGKAEAPDGPRYKALGNSMAVPVMRWIGERINA